METTERTKLANAKLEWRKSMRRFFGKHWSKRKASLMDSSGRRKMNVHKN